MLKPSRRRLAGLAVAMLGLTALGGCAGLVDVPVHLGPAAVHARLGEELVDEVHVGRRETEEPAAPVLAALLVLHPQQPLGQGALAPYFVFGGMFGAFTEAWPGEEAMLHLGAESLKRWRWPTA